MSVAWDEDDGEEPTAAGTVPSMVIDGSEPASAKAVIYKRWQRLPFLYSIMGVSLGVLGAFAACVCIGMLRRASASGGAMTLPIPEVDSMIPSSIRSPRAKPYLSPTTKYGKVLAAGPITYEDDDYDPRLGDGDAWPMEAEPEGRGSPEHESAESCVSAMTSAPLRDQMQSRIDSRVAVLEALNEKAKPMPISEADEHGEKALPGGGSVSMTERANHEVSKALRKYGAGKLKHKTEHTTLK